MAISSQREYLQSVRFLKRLAQAEALPWQGQRDEPQALFVDRQRPQRHTFEAYLDKHCPQIINYGYCQSNNCCSVGSGAVECVGSLMAIELATFDTYATSSY